MRKNELQAEIARAGISKRDISAKLGISAQALYNKINGNAEFKASEIKNIAEILSLSTDSVNFIFFSQ